MGLMDKRTAFRFPTDVEADVRSCDRSWSSRLCNISTGGCMITCDETDLPRDALLRLRIKGLTAIDGTIAWINRGHAGVRFQAPLHPAVMEHLAFRGREEGLTGRAGDAPAPPPQCSPGLHAKLIKRYGNSNDDGGLAEAG
jgi:hypothetical protein